MNKIDHAAYLVSLNSLIEACGRSAVPTPTVLLDEYNKHWDLFKDSIKNEKDEPKAKGPEAKHSESKTIPRKV